MNKISWYHKLFLCIYFGFVVSTGLAVHMGIGDFVLYVVDHVSLPPPKTNYDQGKSLILG